MLEEKPDVIKESQECSSKTSDNQPNVETDADSKSGGSDGDFDSVMQIEERNVAKLKTDAFHGGILERTQNCRSKKRSS